MPKKGAWTVCRFKGWTLQDRGGGVFEGGGGGTPMHTMTMANVFLSNYELKWLKQCTSKFEPVFYRRYVDHILALLESAEHLSKFHAYLHT